MWGGRQYREGVGNKMERMDDKLHIWVFVQDPKMGDGLWGIHYTAVLKISFVLSCWSPCQMLFRHEKGLQNFKTISPFI